MAFVAVRGACFSSCAPFTAEEEGVSGGDRLLGTGGGALAALPPPPPLLLQPPSAGLAALVRLAGADGLGGADAENDLAVLLVEETEDGGEGVSGASGGSCFDADTDDDAAPVTLVRS